jgi:hypothetical protein
MHEFNEEFAGSAEYAEMYRSIGWQVVPSLHPSENRAWKRPCVKWKEYQNELVSDELFGSWYRTNGEHIYRTNMGLMTGECSGNIMCVDLDIQKLPKALEWWQDLLDDYNCSAPLAAPTQRTGGGGLQIFVRAPQGYVIPTGKTSIGVDIRGHGGFAVLPPSMHESGKAYSWMPGSEPWAISIPEAAEWLLEAVETVLRQFGGATHEGGPAQRTDSPETAHNEFGAIVDGREDYMTKLIWAKVVDHKREHARMTDDLSSRLMHEAFNQYASTVKSRLREAGISNADLLEREGRGITEFAKKWHIAMGKWSTDVSEAAAVPKKQETAPSKPFTVVEGPDGVQRPDFEPFPMMSVPMIKVMPDPKWLIEGVVIENAFGLIYGAPGCGKTFISLSMALSIAAGLTDWWGYKINKHGPVIYISSEGVSDLKFRITAWEQATGISVDDIPFYLIHVPINFMDSSDIERLSMTIQYSDMLMGEPPVAMFVDTVSRALPGADENLQKDMTLFVRACDLLKVEFGCTVTGIHHTNKQSGMRGSTVLDGAADFIYEIKREEGVMIGEMKAKKIKAAADGWVIPFKLTETLCGDVAGNTSLFAEKTTRDELQVSYDLPSKYVCQEILNAMERAWNDNKPWSTQPNTRRDGRYAAMLMTKWEVTESAAESLLNGWLLNGIVEVDICDKRNKIKGLKVNSSLYY